MRRTPTSVATLTEFGRERLSLSFFMRDFLYSEIAQVHGMLNAPEDPDLAIATGRRLCVELLEPLQAAFGRIAVRSAYRSPEVNACGNAEQAGGKAGYNCAGNEANAAHHIWDRRDADGGMGAMACVVVPALFDRFGHEANGWQRIAWWVHDHLPYSELEFFPRYWAFNIAWHETPRRSIYARIPNWLSDATGHGEPRDRAFGGVGAADRMSRGAMALSLPPDCLRRDPAGAGYRPRRRSRAAPT